MSFHAPFRSYHWFLLIYFFFAWAYINVMRLCAPLSVCWHVCKNREGLETILLQPWCLWYICLCLTFNENSWQYLFLVLFCVESVQCNHQLTMDVYTRPELTNMMCYGVAGGNGRRALRMYQNGFQTEIALTTQCFLAFFSAFLQMGLFVPSAQGVKTQI